MSDNLKKEMQDPAPVSAGMQDSEPVKTGKKENLFTRSDVDNVVLKAKDEAVTNLLNELGIESEGKLKDKINAFKQWEDSQKSEIERAQEQARLSAEEAERIKKEKLALNNKVTALSRNIPSDKVDKYLKLAEVYPDVELSVALDMAISEFPFEQPKSNTIAQFGTQTIAQTNSTDAFVDALRKGRNKSGNRNFFSFNKE